MTGWKQKGIIGVRGQAGKDFKKQRRKKQNEAMGQGLTNCISVVEFKRQLQEGHNKGYKIPWNQDGYTVSHDFQRKM